eukprot:gene4927-6895_t
MNNSGTISEPECDNLNFCVDCFISELTPDFQTEYQNLPLDVTWVETLLTSALGAVSFTIGGHLTGTNLYDDPVEVTQIVPRRQMEKWKKTIYEVLIAESTKFTGPELEISRQLSDVTTVFNKIELSTSVNKQKYSLSANKVNSLFLAAIAEEMDAVIGQNHLFKRSLILIKAWCKYESKKYAHFSISEVFDHEALTIMTLWLFTTRAETNLPIDCAFDALVYFLEDFCAFDWDNCAISVANTINNPIRYQAFQKALSSRDKDTTTSSANVDVNSETLYQVNSQLQSKSVLKSQLILLVEKYSRMYEGMVDIEFSAFQAAMMYHGENEKMKSKPPGLGEESLDLDKNLNLATNSFPQFEIGSNFDKILYSNPNVAHHIPSMQTTGVSLNSFEDFRGYNSGVGGQLPSRLPVKAFSSNFIIGNNEVQSPSPADNFFIIFHPIVKGLNVCEVLKPSKNNYRFTRDDVIEVFQKASKECSALIMKLIGKMNQSSLESKNQSWNDILSDYFSISYSFIKMRNRYLHLRNSNNSPNTQEQFFANLIGPITSGGPPNWNSQTDPVRDIYNLNTFRSGRSKINMPRVYSLEHKLASVLPVINRYVQHTGIVLSSELSPDTLISLALQVLNKMGPTAIGELGKQMQSIADDPDLLRSVKKSYLGLKKFLEAYPTIFRIGLDHEFNPKIYIVVNKNILVEKEFRMFAINGMEKDSKFMGGKY